MRRSAASPSGRGGGLVLAMKDGLALLDDWDAAPRPFGEQIFADRPDLRFNDGRTDPAGRFWVGSVNMTKSARDAALYRVDPDGEIHFIEGGMLTCNGAAFSANGTAFRHADTPSHELRAYDADPVAGTLANRRIVRRFPEGRGRPDGGSFDAEGALLVRFVRRRPGRAPRRGWRDPLHNRAAGHAPDHDRLWRAGPAHRLCHHRAQRPFRNPACRAAACRRHLRLPVDVPGLPEIPFAG